MKAWAKLKFVVAALSALLAIAWTGGSIAESHAGEVQKPVAGENEDEHRISVKMAPPVVVATVPQSGKTNVGNPCPLANRASGYSFHAR